MVAVVYFTDLMPLVGQALKSALLPSRQRLLSLLYTDTASILAVSWLYPNFSTSEGVNEH
jgi:hypothetical protein